MNEKTFALGDPTSQQTSIHGVPVGTEMNAYGRQLSAEEIERGDHRTLVGGLWEEIGALQFAFLREQGLRPEHLFLDVGCGALRGGIHFVRYLHPGNYFGLDVNASLLDAGRLELSMSGLSSRGAQLMQDDGFRLHRFGVRFDMGLALSLFTHLPMNSILRCLHAVAEVLAPGGVFYATYFRAPRDVFLEPLTHTPGGVVSHSDHDPFHYSFEELASMGRACGLVTEDIGHWQHPRSQQIAAFRRMF